MTTNESYYFNLLFFHEWQIHKFFLHLSPFTVLLYILVTILSFFVGRLFLPFCFFKKNSFYIYVYISFSMNICIYTHKNIGI